MINVCQCIECPCYDKKTEKCKEYTDSSNCHLLKNGMNPNLDTTGDDLFLLGLPSFVKEQLQELKKENLAFFDIIEKRKREKEFLEMRDNPINLCTKIHCPMFDRTTKRCNRYLTGSECHLIKDLPKSHCFESPVGIPYGYKLTIQVKEKLETVTVFAGGGTLYITKELENDLREELKYYNTAILNQIGFESNYEQLDDFFLLKENNNDYEIKIEDGKIKGNFIFPDKYSSEIVDFFADIKIREKHKS